MRFYAAALLTLFGLMLAPVGARAAANQDQGGCMMDAETFCGKFIPNRVRVAHCLIANRRKISPACREAVKHFH
ncbi:MAG: hypothetical protein WBB34_16090 [Xanthobacteraceae bacterium]